MSSSVGKPTDLACRAPSTLLPVVDTERFSRVRQAAERSINIEYLPMIISQFKLSLSYHDGKPVSWRHPWLGLRHVCRLQGIEARFLAGRSIAKYRLLLRLSEWCRASDAIVPFVRGSMKRLEIATEVGRVRRLGARFPSDALGHHSREGTCWRPHRLNCVGAWFFCSLRSFLTEGAIHRKLRASKATRSWRHVRSAGMCMIEGQASACACINLKTKARGKRLLTDPSARALHVMRCPRHIHNTMLRMKRSHRLASTLEPRPTSFRVVSVLKTLPGSSTSTEMAPTFVFSPHGLSHRFFLSLLHKSTQKSSRLKYTQRAYDKKSALILHPCLPEQLLEQPAL